MYKFTDVYRYEGKPMMKFKHLPILLYDIQEQIEEYIDEEAIKLTAEQCPEDCTEEEWEETYWENYGHLLDTELGECVLTDDEDTALNEDVYAFQDDTGIDVRLERRAYGQMQLCVDEDKLDVEELAQVQEFFKEMQKKYGLAEWRTW